MYNVYTLLVERLSGLSSSECATYSLLREHLIARFPRRARAVAVAVAVAVGQWDWISIRSARRASGHLVCYHVRRIIARTSDTRRSQITSTLNCSPLCSIALFLANLRTQRTFALVLYTYGECTRTLYCTRSLFACLQVIRKVEKQSVQMEATDPVSQLHK